MQIDNYFMISNNIFCSYMLLQNFHLQTIIRNIIYFHVKKKRKKTLVLRSPVTSLYICQGQQIASIANNNYSFQARILAHIIHNTHIIDDWTSDDELIPPCEQHFNIIDKLNQQKLNSDKNGHKDSTRFHLLCVFLYFFYSKISS